MTKYCLQCRKKLVGSALDDAYCYRVNGRMRWPFCSKGCMFKHMNDPIRKNTR